MEENENQNQNQNQNPNKKSSKGLFIFIGVLIIVVAMLVGYIFITQSNNEESSNANETNTSISEKVKKAKDADEESDEDDEENEANTSKNKASKSSFGKKDKNTTNSTNTNKNETNTTNTEKKENTTTSNSTLSKDWKSGEFIFDGKAYKLNGDYKKFVENGWSIDLSKNGYEDGYILNKNDKTYSTISLENSKYKNAYVNIGFANLDNSAKDITETQVWAISVENYGSYYAKVNFELPGGIKYGSTIEEIEAVYGKPEDEYNIYRSDDLKYTAYTYESRDNGVPQLRLTIYDEEGLTSFDYKIY